MTDTDDVVASHIRKRAEAGAARPNPLTRTPSPLDGPAPDKSEREAVRREAAERMDRWDEGWRGAIGHAATEKLNRREGA